MANVHTMRAYRRLMLLAVAWIVILGVSACTPGAGPGASTGAETDAAAVDEAGTPTNTAVGAGVESGAPVVSEAVTSVDSLDGTVSPPSVLPEGAAVAYVDAKGLNYIDADGPQLLVPDATEGVIAASPDGRWVAFMSRSGEWENDVIAVVATDTGEVRDLVQTNELELPAGFDAVPEPRLRLLTNMRWAPDGKLLYFTTFVGPTPGAEDPVQPTFLDDLWTVDPESAAIVEVFAPGEGGQFEFSPDGTKLAVTASGWSDDSEATLTVADSDGGNRRELFTFPRAGNSELRMYAKPYWSDDGERVSLAAFEQDTAIEEMATKDVVVHRVTLDGDVETITGIPGVAVRFGGPTFVLPLSPHGDRLAMLLPSDEAAAPTTVVAGPTESSAAEVPPRMYLGDLVESPDWSREPAYAVASRMILGDWSPDGQRFMYSAKRASTVSPEEEDAFYVGQTGREPSRIVDATKLMRVQWLGSEHLIMLLRAETPWLVLASVDGTLELLAKLDEDPEDERPSYVLSAVDPPEGDA